MIAHIKTGNPSRDMKLEINDLVLFLKNQYPGIEDIISASSIRECGIDGDDAIKLLTTLGQKFSVNFENFDFHTYFLEEIEISRALSWFGLKKPRQIHEHLSVEKLYFYMINNFIDG